MRAVPSPASVTTMPSAAGSVDASARTIAWAMPGTAFGAAPPSISTIAPSSKRLLVSVALVGMAGYGVYLTALALLQSAVGANFVAALAVALAAEILARRQKAPANIFSLIGIVPLVPGGGLYQTMLALVMDDYSAALSTGVQTMLIAGAIALAIAVVAVFFRALPARQK